MLYLFLLLVNLLLLVVNVNSINVHEQQKGGGGGGSKNVLRTSIQENLASYRPCNVDEECASEQFCSVSDQTPGYFGVCRSPRVTCRFNEDCDVNSQYCASTRYFISICKPRVTVGKTCNSADMNCCRAGLTCLSSTNTCEVPHNIGETCIGSADCNLDILYCNGTICNALVPFGQYCDALIQCQRQFTCYMNVCSTPY
jgi:hypothetical protein